MANYGCLPPKIDLRDYKISAKKAGVIEYPKEFILQHPRVKNQGDVNSCVAHATSSILEYYSKNRKLSTNFIYGIQKQLCGQNSSGMYLIDACKIVQKYGDMTEADCPGNYEVPKCHSVAEKALLNTAKQKRAEKFIIDSYYACENNNDIKFALMHYGPVLACLKWFDNFELDTNNIIHFSDGNYGYHAVMIYGWNEFGFIIQNSWGEDFADQGSFILPYHNANLVEARVLIDHIDENDSYKSGLVKHKTNKIKNFVYKLLNSILNKISN